MNPQKQSSLTKFYFVIKSPNSVSSLWTTLVAIKLLVNSIGIGAPLPDQIHQKGPQTVIADLPHPHR